MATKADEEQELLSKDAALDSQQNIELVQREIHSSITSIFRPFRTYRELESTPDAIGEKNAEVRFSSTH